MTGVNPIRGEAEVAIGGGKYVLSATMESLAELSRTAACETIQDLYRRLIGTELFTTRAALAVFVQGGTDPDGKQLKKREAAAAAVLALDLDAITALQLAFVTILEALTSKKPSSSGSDDPNAKAAPG